MTRRPYPLFVGALASCALVAACGGGAAHTRSQAGPAAGSSSPTSAPITGTPTATTSVSSSATTTSTASATSTAASTTATHTSATAPLPASPSQNLSAEVAVCKQEVASLTSTAITPAEKIQLANLCTIAGTRDQARVKAAERRICLTVIKDSAPGLGGPAIAAEEQSCNRF